MKSDQNISKTLCYFLRHKPEELNLKLEPEGWISIDKLLSALKKKNINILINKLEEIVCNCPKQRFSIKNNKIKANQGHSTNIDLNLKPSNPPDILYHGTAVKNKDKIFQKGILKMSRHHVHLSDNIETAIQVGKRHGKPIIFHINSKQMSEDGIIFYKSDNNVWLTDYINPKYIYLN